MSLETNAPAIAGVTTASRAARDAEMQPLSAENAAAMPSISELAESFGIKLSQPKAPAPEEILEDEAPEADEPAPEAIPEDEAPVELEEDEEPEPEEEPTTPAPEAPVQKRINQLTAKNSDLTAQLAEARQQLAQANRPTPTQADPLAHIATVEDLDAEVQHAQQVRLTAMRNPFGMTVKDKDGADVEYDETQMRHILLNAETTLAAAQSKRADLAAFEADETALLSVAPHLRDAKHDHTVYLGKVLASQGRELGIMAQRAKMSPKRLAYALALGLNQLSAPASPATRPAPPRKAPPIPSPRTAPRGPAKDIHAKQAAKQPIAGNNRGAVERRIEASLSY